MRPILLVLWSIRNVCSMIGTFHSFGQLHEEKEMHLQAAMSSNAATEEKKSSLLERKPIWFLKSICLIVKNFLWYVVSIFRTLVCETIGIDAFLKIISTFFATISETALLLGSYLSPRSRPIQNLSNRLNKRTFW